MPGRVLTALWLVLLGLASAAPPASPAPAAPLGAVATPEPAVWRATFHHAVLRQVGTLRAGENTCQLAFHGSQPAEILLTKRVDTPISPGRRLTVYVGWPRNPAGQVSGVRNISADPPHERIIENKLGPTLVWAMQGCANLCVKALILDYQITLTQRDGVHDIVRIDRPTNDGCAGPTVCLAPVFQTRRAQDGRVVSGALDQPGCTFAAVGDGFLDTSGRSGIVTAGDRVSLRFQQRAFVICGDTVEAVVDWGFAASARVASTSALTTPDALSEPAWRIALRTDTQPSRRAQYNAAITAARNILQLP